MGTIKQDTVEFKFVGESVRKSFNSTEEALAYVKKKNLLPTNGKSWEIEEIHTKVISYTFESERKVIDNIEITKKIIDYFLEHATIENVHFSKDEVYINDPENRNFRYYSQMYAYLCCKKYLGYDRDKFVELYKKFYKENCDKDGHAFETYICELCCYYALKDKYGIDEADIHLVTDPKYKWKTKNPIFKEKYNEAYLEVYDWIQEMFMADGGHFRKGEYGRIMEEPKIWHYVKGQELLDLYKETLRALPIEKMKWSYNSGNYSPCNNYKLEVVDFEKIRESLELRSQDSIHLWGAYIPGIMFRDGDIMITEDNYYGRNVSLSKSKSCDVDEKLYKYCIKNLK